MAAKNGLEFLKTVSKFMCESRGFDAVLKNIKIVSGGNGRCLAEFKVQEENLNRGHTLHGGLTATIVDNFTTYALMSKDHPPGVTVNLSVSYLKAAKEGDIVEIDARAVKTGKKLAYLECELRLKETGAVIAKGNQTKYIAETK